MKKPSVSELVGRFREIMDVALLPLECNEDGESNVRLHQTRWVRILVIRNLVDTSRVSVVVELALPKHANSRATECQELVEYESMMMTDTYALLEGMITHLQYLGKIHESGFGLELIEHGCLWVVSRDFTEMPNEDIFKLLLPP